MEFPKNRDGRYSASAWPGLYEIAYFTDDGAWLCARCMNGENGSIASLDAEPRSGWRVINYQSVDFWNEGEACAHCGAWIGPEQEGSR